MRGLLGCMRKKTAIIGLSGVALAIAVAAFFAAECLHARFHIINASPHGVTVTAYWRDREEPIGLIRPSSRHTFRVSDEAAMRFSVRFPDDRAIESREIYFTGGTDVIVTISVRDVSLRYDFETGS